LAGKILLTIFSIAVLLFAIRNYLFFREEIETYWTIRIFYFYSALALVMGVWVAWIDICKWSTIYW